MVNCPNLKNGLCVVAGNLSGLECKTTEPTCAACTNRKLSQQVNDVTCGLAFISLHIAGKWDKEQYLEISLWLEKKAKQGPGTELKKLISWFPIPKKNGCKACRSLEVRMNAWGPDKCDQKIDYICKKLWVAAKRRKLPFSRSLVEKLVRKAIRNAMKETK